MGRGGGGLADRPSEPLRRGAGGVVRRRGGLGTGVVGGHGASVTRLAVRPSTLVMRRKHDPVRVAPMSDATATSAPTDTTPDDGLLERLFHISRRGSTVGREVRGGVATFFTMAYIVVLNPLILGFVQDADGKYLGGGDAPNLAAIAAGTALVAGVLTILMGLYANFPLALATGLGLNAFVAFAIASKMTWADAMGLVVIEGLVILVLVLTGFREAVFHAVPAPAEDGDLAWASACSSRSSASSTPASCAARGAGPVPVELGIGGQLAGWPTLVFALGLVLIIALWVRKVKGAIIIAIITMTVLAFVVEAVAERRPHGHRRRRRGQQRRQPDRLEPLRARVALAARPDQLRHPRRVQPPRLLQPGRRRRGDPPRLHPPARRLLRHHGHDDGHRRRGRPPRRGGQPAPHPAASSSSTRSRPPRAARPVSRRTRPTSSRPRASARARAPGWRRSSPGCCSCVDRRDARSCTSSPTRPRCRRSSSSASS